MGLARRIALSRSRDIRHVLDNGRRVGDGLLKLNVLPCAAECHSRFALVVPKFKRSVVDRNRLRRRLQEIVRRAGVLESGRLVVLRITPDCYGLKYSELNERYLRLARKVESCAAARSEPVDGGNVP
ncbi:ribonuclease P protein component [bacterium]|nr:ribonuclease P protein component [bacterium]